ncbi:transposase [Antarcticibacterium sp. 1MA-6-2]|uniref:transposase n=1 Tax=Antarcticibacterium sp. 1MA-6-2 TaxID=2908210 RepID=UPI001F1CB915|nr:transposase [Antarcticibacterium sp. 1MA-6-2]UJH89883.1 transposase [Antarcticibacterium sp. 1MA-6-2]
MEPLEEGCYYHIYNRGNNRQKIFFEGANYKHFLKLIKQHLLPVVELYCYCLLRNHFHLLVKVKNGAIYPSPKFSNLFNAYTKAINKKYDRTGSLFQRPFRRKRISDENYLRNSVIYIHLNPEAHKFHKNFQNYPFSSYSQFFDGRYSILKREEVIEWFGDLENFRLVHLKRNNN